MSKQFPGVDIDAVHGGETNLATDMTDDEIIAEARRIVESNKRNGWTGSHWELHLIPLAERLLQESGRYVLPPAWIPVGERLPEVPLGKEQLVWICWVGDDGKRTVCDLWYVNRPHSEEYDGASWVIEDESTGDAIDCVGWHEVGASSSYDEFFMPFDRPEKIIAWMPIDKPDAPATISKSE